MSTRTFGTGAVLSVYTGYLVTENFSDVHELIEHLAGGPVWTHQLGDATAALNPALLGMLPWLGEIEAPAPFNGAEHCRSWVALVSATYGAEHQVATVEGGWSRNPVTDLAEMVGPERAIVVVDGGEAS